MELTPEAEESMEHSMRKKQEERKRQDEQQENNEHLTKMLAKEIQALPSHQCNDLRIPDLEKRIAELERMVGALSSQAHDTYHSDSGIIESGSPLDGVKFSLMRVVVDDFLRGWGCYIAPQKPEEFTAPQSLDTYPGGLLEYIVQCGRKNGFPHNRIAFKMMEMISDDNWETQEELCEQIVYELVNKHHQPPPNPEQHHLGSYYKINNIILNERSSWVTLPSGIWSLTLYHQVSFTERVGSDIEIHWYKAMELKLEKEPV
jgi:hypothetical protein